MPMPGRLMPGNFSYLLFVSGGGTVDRSLAPPNRGDVVPGLTEDM